MTKRYSLTMLVASVCVSLLIAPGAFAQLRVSVDPDGDGVFEKIRSYPVTFEEAIEEFAKAGGALWDGTGAALNIVSEGLAASFTEPQSWDGFLSFLDNRYPGGSLRTFALCDDMITALFGWTCGAPLDCTPVTDCQGLVATIGLLGFDCIPGGVPECPDAKSRCVSIPGALPNIESFTTAGGTACHCPGGVGGACLINPAATVTGFMFTGDVCRCAVPALSAWGMGVLGLLVVAAGVVVVRRRMARA